MPLGSGSRVGPYEILALLGQGGMGEVYRARDSKLGRDVALKILPDELVNDPDRRARFEREAQVLASLNHPNIAGIYGLEDSGATKALVLELVEGPTLAEYIAGQNAAESGQSFRATALSLARQIAEALEAAHERGIIHRDLKPANIKIRPDGTVKVLDFGLAKALGDSAATGSGASARPDITHSPTLTLGGTQAGVILGTAGYMSPEQARGQSVDRGSDIWAFGCVVYEMLAGKPAFPGETITDILSGIVRADPDWSVLPGDTPPAMRSLLRRCLNKDRKRRLKDIADARLEIEEALAEPVGSAGTTTTKPPAKASAARELIAWIAAGVLLLIGAASLPYAIVHLREPARDDRPVQFEVVMPEGVFASGSPPAISPDGRRLAFAANLGGKTQLWIRRLDSTAAQLLPGTEGADYPSWSPDGRFIAFFAGGKLRKIDASGGPPETLCDAPVGRGAAWSRGGSIIFAMGATGPLYRIAASGGTPTPVTTLETSKGEIYHRNPSFLPDGRHFVFFVQGPENSQGIHVGAFDEPGHRLLVKTESSGAYATPGYLLFVRERRILVAQRFAADRLIVTGDAVPVAEPVGLYNASSASFSVSDSGVLAYYSGIGGIGSDRLLAWFDRTGQLLERIGAPMPIADVALSPDQKRAAVQWLANDIRVVDLVRGGTPSRLTFNVSVEDFPVWSPDGSRVLYTSTAAGGQNLYSKLSSGAGSEEEVFKSSPAKSPTDWSERFMLYEEEHPQNQADLWALPTMGDRKPLRVLGEAFAEQQGRFSPDGKWIAYVSNETGTPEVYVQSFPPSGGKWQVSTTGGVTPRWRRDGKELFYMAPDRKIMAAPVRTSTGTFEFDAAKALFETSVDSVTTAATNRYDVSADGQRFLVNAASGNAVAAPITVIVNWLAGPRAGR